MGSTEWNESGIENDRAFVRLYLQNLIFYWDIPVLHPVFHKSRKVLLCPSVWALLDYCNFYVRTIVVLLCAYLCLMSTWCGMSLVSCDVLDNSYLCDVWMFGIVMWSLVTSQSIFHIWYYTLVSVFELSYATYMFRFKFSLTACFNHLSCYSFCSQLFGSAPISSKNIKMIVRFSVHFQLYLQRLLLLRQAPPNVAVSPLI